MNENEQAQERSTGNTTRMERAVLGSCMVDDLARNDAMAGLKIEDFQLDSHRKIFSVVVALDESANGVDDLTVANELARRAQLGSIGGPTYLASLSEGLPRKLNIESYVHAVREQSRKRQILAMHIDGSDAALMPQTTSADLLESVERTVAGLSDQNTRGFADVATVVRESFGDVDGLCKQGREISGLATHYALFDRMTSGLQPSDLIIIAGRPSMGKTAWAMNIAQNAAVKDGKVVGFFSLEMSRESLLRRMLAGEAMVRASHIQKGNLYREDRLKLAAALERLKAAALHIDDTAASTVPEIRAKARRLRQQAGQLDLIVIDYLQLVGVAGKRENRTQEVALVSRSLKALAKELRVPVVALSQLSRSSEQRGGHRRPMLSDLRDSGSIEQDADVVAFIHREEYYDRENDAVKGKAEIIVAKQRNGPTDTIALGYSPEYQRFDDLPPMGSERAA